MVTTAVPVLVHPQRSLHLRGARLGAVASDGPLILQRMDQKVVPAVLDELSRADAKALLATEAKARDASGTLKLFHPVQRAHHLALFEICCSRPGEPRLDPLKIESAGLVLRRIWRDPATPPAATTAATTARGTIRRAKSRLGELEASRHAPSLDLLARQRIRSDVLEGWRQQGQKLRGWLPFAGDEGDLDPDPALRRAPRTGNAEMDRRLALWRGVAGEMAEQVTPLFPAPPAVAEALGRTILYGIIPVASTELSETPAEGAFDAALVRERLSPYLRATGMPNVVPLAGQRVGLASLTPSVEAGLSAYVNMLRQLVFELDAFGDSAASLALFAALQAIELPFAAWQSPHGKAGTRPAGTTLRQHAEVLLHHAAVPQKVKDETWDEYPSVDMPAKWPEITTAVESAIVSAAQRVLAQRLGIVAPNEPRYADATRLYKLRAFARVKRPGSCPPRLVWSGYSEAFVIAPWYESAGAPPVQVALPDVTDRAAIKQLKPNVSFVVPASLAKFLNQSDPKSLLKGDGPAVSDDAPGTPGPDGLELKVDWLCAFNIPTITLCAFIVLNIFLSLLDLFLGWLKLAIKICLPFPHLVPRKSSSP